jgi:hypothetical protein
MEADQARSSRAPRLVVRKSACAGRRKHPYSFAPSHRLSVLLISHSQSATLSDLSRQRRKTAPLGISAGDQEGYFAKTFPATGRSRYWLPHATVQRVVSGIAKLNRAGRPKAQTFDPPARDEKRRAV